jgi:hypothetical protein
MVGDSEGELFVFGADAELCLRLATRFEPGDQLVARLDWGHVDLVARHAHFQLKRAATLNMLHCKGQ